MNLTAVKFDFMFLKYVFPEITQKHFRKIENPNIKLRIYMVTISYRCVGRCIHVGVHKLVEGDPHPGQQSVVQ